jgi:hypothetical protein
MNPALKMRMLIVPLSAFATDAALSNAAMAMRPTLNPDKTCIVSSPSHQKRRSAWTIQALYLGVMLRGMPSPDG